MRIANRDAWRGSAILFYNPDLPISFLPLRPFSCELLLLSGDLPVKAFLHRIALIQYQELPRSNFSSDVRNLCAFLGERLLPEGRQELEKNAAGIPGGGTPGQMECGRGRNYGIFRSYAIFDKSDITRERFRIYEIFITQNQCLRKCSPTFDLPLVEPRRRNRNQQKNGI